MGWWSNKQEESANLVRDALRPLVPGGEQLVGGVFGNQQRRMSNNMFAVGVSENHLLIQPVTLKGKPNGTGVCAARSEVSVSNIFSEGAGFTLGRKGQEVRFTAKGVEYKLQILGGSFFENMLASDTQLSGLDAVSEFLRSTV